MAIDRPHRLVQLEVGLRQNALFYLLFLRLVPLFPFVVVNLVPALLGVGLRDFVLGNEETVRFVDEVVEMLTWQLPAFQREGKSYLTVAFGCTGGHHRSVAIAEEVARRLGEGIKAQHRDVAR